MELRDQALLLTPENYYVCRQELFLKEKLALSLYQVEIYNASEADYLNNYNHTNLHQVLGFVSQFYI
jgi:hypothetical protein